MKTLHSFIFFMLIPFLTWAQKTPSLFLDNGYRTDSVLVSGQILNRTTHSIPTIEYTHFITDESVSITANIDSIGNFSARVPILNTTKLFINDVAKGFNIPLFAEPGEKIHITADWKQNKVIFKGTRAKEHQFVFNHDTYLESINRYYMRLDVSEDISHEEYLQKVKRYKCQQDSLLNLYVKRTPNISPKALQEIQINNLNRIGFFLMQRSFRRDRMNGELFHKNYTDFADSIFAVQPQPYTIASATFLDDYLNYYNETLHKTVPFRQALVEYAIEKKKITPNEEQLKNFNLILQAKEFKVKLTEAFNELRETEQYQQIMLDYYTRAKLTLPMPEKLKELTTAQTYYKYLCANRIPLSDTNLTYFKQQVKNPELQKFVLDYQQQLSNLANSQYENPESLKDASVFNDCQTGEAIFTKLIKPFEGKIIYLDVWGTWCVPCKKEMSYTGKIKEAMQGKDIVFMYLANGSPETSWKNIIKEMHLTGKQVVHYNFSAAKQNLLEKYLNVDHYPTYFIIDRKGNILEKDTQLRPSSGEKLIDHLNKLLSE